MKRKITFFVVSMIALAVAAHAQTWNYLGSSSFSAGGANFISLAIGPDGTTYVSYADNGNTIPGAITVMKYNGSSWVAVGNPGFSPGEVINTSLAIDGSGTPYVAYADYNNATKATVMKFDGSSWVNVGSPDFSAGEADFVSLAIAANGTPYLAYSDYGNGEAATVMTYNGSSWVPVGSPGFSGGTAYYTSLAINSSGVLYLAYQDQSTINSAATVKQYNGSSWVTVGSAGFSAGIALYTSLAIDGSGTPYVAYADNANGNKTTVMKYNGSAWTTVGSPGFSSGSSEYTSLAINTSGTPYVAYFVPSNDPGDPLMTGGVGTVMQYNGSSWVTVDSASFSAAEQPMRLAIGNGTLYAAYGQTPPSGFGPPGVSVEYYTDNPPVFTGGSTQSLTVCENSGAASINSLLTITDPDASQTETFTLTSTPTNGTVTTGTTAASGTSVSPAGWSYTPTTGYSGTDAFTIHVSDGAGGTATMAINVTVNALPAVTAPASAAVCAGSSVTLTGGGAVSYSWTGGATDGVPFIPIATTTYTVTGTDANSCTNTATTTITINPKPGVIGGGVTAVINTIAGTGAAGYSGNGGPATAATFNLHWGGLVYDAAGDLYVADGNNNVVRKISASGTITTIAGTGATGFGGDGGPATAAKLNNPVGLTFDASGNLYIGDFFNGRIRKINTSGTISTIAGTGTSGYNGDNLPATAAELYDAAKVAFDGSGNTYVIDCDNNRVRKINASGIITTVAGNGTQGYSGDGGPATAAKLYHPEDVLFDAAGNMYITDEFNHAIRKINGAGIITTIAGTGGVPGFYGDGGPATAAKLDDPTDMSFDNLGDIIFADESNNVLRMINTAGIITTLAGNGVAGYGGDGGPATAAELNAVNGLAFDGNSGNLALTDDNNNRVRYINLGATVCVGASVTLTSATSGGTWSSNNGGVAVIDPGSGVATGVAGGVTEITYMLGSGCYTTTNITVNALPTVSAGANAAICSGGSTALSGSGAGTGGVYTWSPAIGLSATTGASPTALLTAATTYIYTVTGTNAYGCRSRATETVTVNPLPTAYSVTGGGGYCSGGAGADVGLSNSDNGVSYRLLVNGSLVNTIISTGGALDFGNQAAAGTYTVTAHNAATTCTVNMTGSVSVSINPNYTITATAASNGTITPLGATSVCSGGNQAYTIAAAAGYAISNVSVDGGSVGAVSTYTFSAVSASHSISAAFVPLLPAGALNFDGMNDRIDGTNANLPLGDADRTVEAWIDLTPGYTPPDGFQTIYTWGNFTPGQRTGLLVHHNNITNTNNLYYVGEGNDIDATSAPITSGTWTHVAFTLTGRTVKFYVNGVLVQTGTVTNVPNTTNTVWSISNTSTDNGTREPIDGSMDEVRVWSRVLCQGEIANSMNCQLTGSESGLVAYYQFNQGFIGANNSSVNSLTDLANPTDAGTLKNFALSGTTSNWVAGEVTGSCSTWVPPTATITAEGPTSFCLGSSVVLSANSGAGLSYQWTNFGVNIAGANAQTYTSNTAGSYAVVVTENGNCSATSATTNTIVNPVPNLDPSSGVTICTGFPATLTAVNGLVNYSWIGPAGPVPGGTGNSVTVSPTSSTTYSVTASDGMCSNTATVFVSVNPLPATLTITETDNCNSTSTLSVSSGLEAGATVVWSDGYTVNPHIVNVANNYTATQISSIDNCISLPSNQVTTAPLTSPAAIITAEGPTSFCLGSSVVLSANSGAGLSYQWTNFGVNIAGANAQTYTSNTAGSYAVVVTENGNCSATSAAINTIVNPVPNLDPSSGVTICTGFQATLTAVNGLVNYSWIGPAGPVPDGTGNSITVSPTSSTTYSVTASDGMCSNTATVFVSVNPLPATLTITETDNCNSTSTLSVSSGLEAGATVVWSDGFTVNPHIVFVANNYTATQISSIDNCTSLPSNQVTTVPFTSPAITLSVTNNCDNTSTLAITSGYVPGALINWSNGLFGTTPSLTVTFPTNYTATQTVTVNGCTASPASNEVTATPNLGPTVTVSTTNTACAEGQNGTATANVTVGSGAITSYTWFPSEPVTASVTGLTTGTYSVTVTDDNGCSAGNSGTIGVMDPATVITVTPSVTNVSCNGGDDGQVNLNVTGGTTPPDYSYSWTGDAGGNPATGLPTGTYSVTVTDVNGCMGSASAFVDQPAVLGITCPGNVSVNNDNGVCGAAVTYAAATTAGPVTGINYTQGAGTLFPVGVTTVTATANSISCGTATCAFTVTVTDTQLPVASCNNPTVYLSASGTASVSLSDIENTLGESDNCGINFAVSNLTGNTSFTCANVGANTVTLNVEDVNGNWGTCAATVTVVDNVPPAITAPSNITICNFPGFCYGIVLFPGLPLTSDNCGVANVSSDHPSIIYPVGTTTVTWTVTDIHGNTATATQAVTVNDCEHPTILAMPNNIAVCNDHGNCTGTVSTLGQPLVFDNCGIASITNDHPSATYPVGATTVTWTVTDIHSNTTTATQTVTVNDCEHPTITAPAGITVNNTPGSCGATVSSLGTPVTGDNCGTTAPTNNHPSATYTVGTTTVTWTETDVHGNTATATQTVTVTDNEPPTITAPATVTMNAAPGLCSATVSSGTLGAPATHDNCGVASVSNNAPSSYAVGNTTVTWTVTDIHGNTATATQTVTVTDNQPPTITAPATITVNAAPGLCSATISSLGTPLTHDNCGVATVTNNALTSYPVGNTTVTWTVTDVHGNTATATQTVTVTDNQLPTITAPASVSVNTTAGICGATGVSLGTPVTGDNCGVATTTNNAPATYPVGTTTVTWKVTDIHGNTATATQTVTVTDHEAPTITAPANISVNNNAGFCYATVSCLGTPTTHDNCGVSTVTNNGLATYPVGITTVTWTVTDIHGNTATATQTVTVTDHEAPHAVCHSYTLNLSGGNGTITAANVDGGSYDNCGIASMTVSPNTFTCANAGSNAVTLTVTDIHGNVCTCTSTVTVNYKPSCAISVTPCNTTYTGGVPTNIYLGYGPQSVTLTATATGGSGFTYLWSSTSGTGNLSNIHIANPVFTTTLPGHYTYVVTITNNNGCSTSCSVSVCVIDAVDHSHSGNVLLCHAYGCTPATISCTPAQVATHLPSHCPSDHLGPVGSTCTTSGRESGDDENDIVINDLTVNAFPNPFNSEVHIKILSNLMDNVDVTVYDVTGRVRDTRMNQAVESEIILGQSFIPGIYIVEVKQGGQSKKVKVVKY